MHIYIYLCVLCVLCVVVLFPVVEGPMILYDHVKGQVLPESEFCHTELNSADNAFEDYHTMMMAQQHKDLYKLGILSQLITAFFLPAQIQRDIAA
jgi:hypothetical protein